MDECALGTHNCDTNTETCLNTVGSFDCTCNTGYQRVGDICVGKKILFVSFHNRTLDKGEETV